MRTDHADRAERACTHRAVVAEQDEHGQLLCLLLDNVLARCRLREEDDAIFGFLRTKLAGEHRLCHRLRHRMSRAWCHAWWIVYRLTRVS